MRGAIQGVLAGALLSAALIAVPACTPPPQPNKTKTENPAVRETATQAPKPPAAAAPRRQGPSEQARMAARPAPPPEPEPVNDDPDQFLGQSGVAVAQLLGAPDLIRRDGAAEVWQYRGAAGGRSCALDVFLYGPAESAGSERDADAPPAPGGLEVRFVDLRGAAASLEERRACLAAMIRAQQLRSG
ncbi:MAG: hypothetical protein QNJ84_05535 [Alphaproteobacteria bacterium]|nr:hypothetical protein [Alphaproteobacteria bacterium]